MGFGNRPDGRLYVVNSSAGTVSRYSVNGASLGAVISGLDNPHSLTFSPSGDIYVIFDAAGLVRRFSATGSDLGTMVSGLNHPGGLAFDAQGRMFIPQSGNGGTVEVYLPSGIHVQTISSSDFNGPSGVVFDDLGRLYVANGIGGKILRFSADLTPLGVFVDSGLPGHSAITFVAAAPAPGAPTVTTNAASNVTATTAQINGSFLDEERHLHGEASFEFGGLPRFSVAREGAAEHPRLAKAFATVKLAA